MRAKSVHSMLYNVLLLLVSVTVASCASVGNTQKNDIPEEKSVESEIKEAVHNYIEGWYDKDGARMGRSIHPRLAKRSPDASSSNGVHLVDKAGLMGVIEQFGGDKGLGRTVDITVFEINNNLATVKAVSNEYSDYIHLAFTGGSWQIVNVLWEFRNKEALRLDEETVSALQKPVLDYVEGWYDKDVERVKGGLHPNLAKRNLDENGEIAEYTRQSLLDAVSVYGGGSDTARKFEFTVFDAGKDIASVKLVTDGDTDYMHLIKWKGQWYVLNELWFLH